MLEFKSTSMLNRIKQAKSYDELLALAVEATTYEYASDKTRRKWDRATQSKKNELAKTETEVVKPKKARKTRKGRRHDNKAHQKMAK